MFSGYDVIRWIFGATNKGKLICNSPDDIISRNFDSKGFLLCGAKIWILSSSGENNISRMSAANECSFYYIVACKQYKNPVSNIHFWSIMLKISFILTNYIILFELIEYLCIILVFSCSIFIFATITCCFFLSTKIKIGSRLLQKSPFWKQNY